MARVIDNQFLKGVHGSIDGFVVKQYKYGTVISKKPDMSKVKASELQKLHQNVFADAVAYSREIIRDPKKKKIHSRKLNDGQHVFNALVSAYMKKHLQKG